MIFVFTVIGAVMGIEIFVVRPYGGAFSEPSADRSYIPLFLGKVSVSATLFIIKFSGVIPSDLTVYTLIGV